MAWPSSMPTGSPSTTAKPTGSMPATASCSTMRARCRGETFVTRKITRALARIKLGQQESLKLGNLDALRDWGHARDYVEMQWLMLAAGGARGIFVIATGVQYSVRDFVLAAAAALDMTIKFRRPRRRRGWPRPIRQGHRLGRSALFPTDRGGNTAGRRSPRPSRKLGWTPQTSFADLVAEMAEADLKEAERHG